MPRFLAAFVVKSTLQAVTVWEYLKVKPVSAGPTGAVAAIVSSWTSTPLSNPHTRLSSPLPPHTHSVCQPEYLLSVAAPN